MSSVFMNEMQRNMVEDAALTEQRPRQSPQEDRSPDEDIMMDIEPQEDDMSFIFDGILSALERRLS